MRALPILPSLAVGCIVLIALLVPFLGLPDPVTMDVVHRLAPPSLSHPLGQDEYGRDVLTRLLWGARTSLFVAFSASIVACVLGTALGLIGGFLRGLPGFLAIRSMDVVLSFPPLLLALLVVTLAGPGAGTLIPILALVYLPGFTRVVHGGVLAVRSHDYVEAQRSLGAGAARIMLRTILPNIAGPILVQFSLTVASAIVLESGLSFLGLGVVPPAASWGLMIGAARTTMAQQPLLLLWPCLTLSLTILAMNGLCDGLRDAFDPQGRVRRSRRLADVLAPGLVSDRGTGSRGLLDVRDLTIDIDNGQARIPTVRNVGLHVRAGETLAIVGESGSGKSLTSLAVAGLLPPAASVTEGAAALEGEDLVRAGETRLRQLRGDRLAMVFQDPSNGLNPVHRVGDQIAEAILAHRDVGARQAWTQAVGLLRRVGIPDPLQRARAFPHQLSGGQRQRVMIAIAIANDPLLLIADEPTTALDVTIQAQILQLLQGLQEEQGMGLVFITHSLPVVAEIADRVAVMYAGEVVEEGETGQVFDRPLHPYTRALLESAPVEDGPAPQGIPGVVPPPDALPAGCLFAPRCVRHVAACDAARPDLAEALPGRMTRCIRPEAA